MITHSTAMITHQRTRHTLRLLTTSEMSPIFTPEGHTARTRSLDDTDLKASKPEEEEINEQLQARIETMQTN